MLKNVGMVVAKTQVVHVLTQVVHSELIIRQYTYDAGNDEKNM